MGTRLYLGLASVAVIATLGACGRAGQSAGQTSPDTTMINASAALVETPAASGDTSADSADTCQAAPARSFIGQPDLPATRAALAMAIGTSAIRWIKPGSAVTQDSQPGRLNVIVVEDGRIGSLRCG